MLRGLISCLFICFALPAFARCESTSLEDSLSDAQAHALAQTVENTPYPTGILWRAEADGTTLYLVGTMHIYDPRLDAIMERVAPIASESDLILLETTKEAEAQLQADLAAQPERLFITDGPTLPDLLPEAAWQILADQARARQIPAFMAAKFQPWYLAIMLGIPPCAMEAMTTGARGLDHMIMDQAATKGVPTQALEPPDTIFTLFGREPLEEQIEMLQATIAMNREADTLFATLLAFYFAEEHAAAWEFSRLAAHDMQGGDIAEIDLMFDEMEQTMLTQRNLNWMPVIADAAADHETILIAVGAAHLGGAQGVLHLLEEAGYTLTRLPL